MSSPATYLITGANRGIGRGFVQRILQKPSTTVIAAVRDPSHPTSKALADLPKGPDTKLIVIKLDSAVETDAAAAVGQLREQGITSLDLVIANAGIAQGGTSVRNTSIANTQKHFNINAIGPLALFQATADLLKASKTGSPKFVAVSTIVGSIGSQEILTNFPGTSSPYGASKAALNWFIRLLSFEEPWLTSWVFHPGLVETDLTSGGGMDLKALGAISVEASVADMIKTTWSIEPKDLSGTFRNHDGTVIPW
ncbi:aflatoxin biosynthesis ketoreductase Nor-1 [Colletotrichum tofieldiae]|uniref:Aflatoxin biosynthesis ketoreductase Nor-1 n=1 Tax=Colletotrichum tofieldiae TaxID=708197 RepID=A0A166VPW9_9PEZI|nr:aflatoxin biosynthesis ketoreductase Nor-1 [Colletotrichum tofieldiae]GKT56077.1 aflatoxin biosynthesis ketoreductase Nor-1 [Colletotrichum tofieldiae]GKT81438.1 aflatoxin biosynthesis ketoreductase Nor-1 [Colletotrichum tofieldiae]